MPRNGQVTISNVDDCYNCERVILVLNKPAQREEGCVASAALQPIAKWHHQRQQQKSAHGQSL